MDIRTSRLSAETFLMLAKSRTEACVRNSTLRTETSAQNFSFLSYPTSPPERRNVSYNHLHELSSLQNIRINCYRVRRRSYFSELPGLRWQLDPRCGVLEVGGRARF